MRKTLTHDCFGIGSAGGRLVDILMYGAPQRILELEPEAIPGMYVAVVHCAEWQPERVGAVLVPSHIEQRAQDCVFLERARSM